MEKKDEKAKAKMKAYADAKARAAPSKITVGDLVLARQKKQNKLSTPLDPRPFRVVRKKGTMVTACWNGKYITRNISHFKLSSSMFPDSDDDVNAPDDDLLEATEQSMPESHSSGSDQSASRVGQSSTDGLRHSQCSRKPVVHFGQDDT